MAKQQELRLRHTGKTDTIVSLPFRVRKLGDGSRQRFTRIELAPRSERELVSLLGGLNEACAAVRQQADRIQSLVGAGIIQLVHPEMWQVLVPSVCAAPLARIVKEDVVVIAKDSSENDEIEDVEPAENENVAGVVVSDIVGAPDAIVSDVVAPVPDVVVTVPLADPAFGPKDSAALYQQINERFGYGEPDLSPEDVAEMPALETPDIGVNVEELLQSAEGQTEVASGVPSAEWKVADLISYAEARGIDLSNSRSKAAILRAIHLASR